jgi:hypothetical protein
MTAAPRTNPTAAHPMAGRSMAGSGPVPTSQEDAS